MLTKTEIQAVICMRVRAIEQSCNGYFHNHVDGQIVGLLAALTGEVHPVNSYSTSAEILRAAGIKFEEKNGRCVVPDEEMVRLGFLTDKFDYVKSDRTIFKSW